MFTSLRTANNVRQKEWDPTDKIDFSWRCNELAGEAGEVCNVLKKMHRERVGLPGSRAVKADLAEELADVVICADLCGMSARTDPVGPVNLLEPYDTLTDAGNALAANVGLISGLVLASYRRADELALHLRVVVRVAHSIAKMEGIDLPRAVAAKFNATSEKVGLSTRLCLTAN